MKDNYPRQFSGSAAKWLGLYSILNPQILWTRRHVCGKMRVVEFIRWRKILQRVLNRTREHDDHREEKLIIKPRVKNFLCTPAHPDGCRQNVYEQIQYVKSQPQTKTKKRTLVIGCSTGYGLSSRICAAWGDDAPTIGVCFERPASGNRTATAGWYNTAAFEEFAKEDGIYAKTICGDAYSKEIKDETAKLISQDLGQIDLLVYSLAAPRRQMPDGTVYTSVLKTVDETFTSKSLDLGKNILTEKTVEPATPEEVEATVRVMGGEDWKDWVKALKEKGLLSENFRTVAYSYIGPEMTYPIYNDGTIGQAKKDLYNTAVEMEKEGVSAYVSVNKAVVTQSSSAIPVVPLYMSILYKVMKEKGLHEDTIQQMSRLWNGGLIEGEPKTDIPGRIRLDDWEMRPDVQGEVQEYWDKLTDENLKEYADIDGYWEEFYHLFGFSFDHVDYEADTEAEREIPSISK